MDCFLVIRYEKKEQGYEKTARERIEKTNEVQHVLKPCR